MYNEPPALYDKNTVELMIEEQQEEIRRLEEDAQKRVEELRLNKEELRAKDDELEALRRELAHFGINPDRKKQGRMTGRFITSR